MTQPILVAWDFFGVLNAIVEMEPVLKALQELDAHQIVVSHSSYYEIESYLEAHHLTPYIQKIYGADWHIGDKRLGKAPALRDYISQAGPFAVAMIVGDSLGDIEDGKAAKVKTCLYDPNDYYQSTEHGADYRVADLTEVIELIQNLVSGK